MSTSRDPDLLIEAFLDEGIDALPDRSFDVVRASIERTRQRVVLGPWREHQMNKYVAIGIAAAAVVLIAVVAFQLLPRTGLPGPGVTSTSSPTPHPTAAPTSSVPPTPLPTASPAASPGVSPTAGPTQALEDLPYDANSVPPGRYIVRSAALPISFEVPAGWWTEDGVTVKGGVPGDLTTPDILFWTQQITVVNPDACHRMTGDWLHVDGADEIVEALMAQAGIFHTSGPDALDFDIGEFQGAKIVFGGRENTGLPNASECTDGVLRSWAEGFDLGDGGHPIFEGQVVSLYVVDVDGVPLVLVAIRQADSSPSDVAELESIVESVRVEQQARARAATR
jgi:hypothetical protein